MDKRINPAEERIFYSPNHAYGLKVQTLDHWKTREPIAIFSQHGKELWRAKLPHSHGPRFAVIADSGVTVLFDEWINIKSDHAVTIIPVSGPLHQKVWTFGQVQLALGVDLKAMSQGAKFGPWMGESPVVKGNSVEVPAANETLVVDLKLLSLKRR